MLTGERPDTMAGTKAALYARFPVPQGSERNVSPMILGSHVHKMWYAGCASLTHYEISMTGNEWHEMRAKGRGKRSIRKDGR